MEVLSGPFLVDREINMSTQKKRKHDSLQTEIGVSSPREAQRSDDDDSVLVDKDDGGKKVLTVSDEDGDDEPATSSSSPARERQPGQLAKKQRKNSETSTSRPSQWPGKVWEEFERKLTKNEHRTGVYYSEIPMMTDPEAPKELRDERCHNPGKSQQMMIVVGGKQYQRPLHRIRLMLKMRRQGLVVPDSVDQASHLCPDSVNVDGKGSKHCCNPNHMVLESDKINKQRQRCAGWIWVRRYKNNPGDFWYPTCTHSPPCLRYTPRTVVPSTIAYGL